MTSAGVADGERAGGGPALEPREVAGHDSLDLRLLEHDLAHEDRVRVARAAPWQLPAVRREPLRATGARCVRGYATHPDEEAMVTLTDFQEELCTTSRWDFSDLRALYVNCTLKPSPSSRTRRGSCGSPPRSWSGTGSTSELVRAVDHELAPGVWPDMREHGAARDDWPELYERVQAADILVLGSPIWLGEKSSVCTRVVERLYACSSLLNENGQYAYYGKVGGCLITGNEDGIKHCSMNILYSLQHLGYTIPPQADAGWIGEAGPGPVLPRRGLGRSRRTTSRTGTRRS